MRSHRPLIKHFNVYYSHIPDPRIAADAGAQITIGDMHANSMKFLSALETHDILRISQDAKKTLARIYNLGINDLTKEDYDLYWAIIMRAEVGPKAQLATLRLIGDEFADRGMGDHFTLPIIAKLSKSNIPWHVCLSNHSMSLLRCYENQQPFTATDVDADFCQSIITLETCIKKGFISREKVNNIIKKYYLPHIKIADYTINEDHSLTHYLHGRFGDNHLIGISNQLGLTYDTSSTQNEINCLDVMQQVFETDYVKRGKIAALVYMDDDSSEELPPEVDIKDDRHDINSSESAVSQSIWNRNHNHLVRRSHHRYVHGHDLPSTNPSQNVIELDNILGKEPLLRSFYNNFNYEALYSHESKEFANIFFSETESLVIHPDILALFDSRNVTTLIQADKIYSRVQITIINEFLCHENSIRFWESMQKSISDVASNFLIKLNSDYALWDVIYLLNKNQLLTENVFNLLLESQISCETIFQILLILEHEEVLTKDCPIKNIFHLGQHADAFLDYLIEAREFLPLGSFIFAIMNQFTLDPDEGMFNLDVYKCINTLSLLVADDEFNEFKNSDYFSDFINQADNYKNHNNRLMGLYRELTSNFDAMLDANNSKDSSEASYSGSTDDSSEASSEDEDENELLKHLLSKFPLHGTAIDKTIMFMNCVDSDIKNHFIDLLGYITGYNLKISPALFSNAINTPIQLIALAHIWKYIKNNIPPESFQNIFLFDNLHPLLRFATILATISLDNTHEHIHQIISLNKEQLNDLNRLAALLGKMNILSPDRLHGILDITSHHPEQIEHYLYYLQLDTINITAESFDALCKLRDLVDKKTITMLELYSYQYPDTFKRMNAELLHWVTLSIALKMNISPELIELGSKLENDNTLNSITNVLHHLKRHELFTEEDFHLLIDNSNEFSEISEVINLMALNGHFNSSIWKTMKQYIMHIDGIFALSLRSAYIKEMLRTVSTNETDEMSTYLVDTMHNLIKNAYSCLNQHLIFSHRAQTNNNQDPHNEKNHRLKKLSRL